MKKLFTKLFVSLVLAAGIFAATENTPLIDAAKSGDYARFEQLVNQGQSLDEVNERGLTLQCALAYFNDEDFAKACELLNSKKFNFNKTTKDGITLVYLLSYSLSYNKLEALLKYKPDLTIKTYDHTPIEVTQKAAYKFYSEQVMEEDAYQRGEKVRQLLKKAGSPKFKKMSATIRDYGNFLGTLYGTLNPFYGVSFDNLNNIMVIKNETINGFENATVSKKGLLLRMGGIGVDLEISETYTNPDEIIEKIDMAAKSEYPYAIIAQTGNNPLEPYQWVVVKGYDEPITPETTFSYYSSDQLSDIIDYQIKDISQLVLIKFK